LNLFGGACGLGSLSRRMSMRRRLRSRATASTNRVGLGPSPTGALAAALAVALAISVAASPARAQQLVLAPIDIEAFRPAMDSKGYITLISSQVLGQLDFSFGLVSTYGRKVVDFTN